MSTGATVDRNLSLVQSAGRVHAETIGRLEMEAANYCGLIELLCVLLRFGRCDRLGIQ